MTCRPSKSFVTFKVTTSFLSPKATEKLVAEMLRKQSGEVAPIEGGERKATGEQSS